MKKFFYLFAAAAFLFAACSDDDDNDNNNNSGLVDNITVNANQITNAPEDGEIDEVALVAYKLYSSNGYEVDKVAWNNGFTFELKNEVPEAYLSNIVEVLFEDDEELKGVTISDRNAKLVSADIEGLKDGEWVRDFYFTSKAYAEADVEFYYCDRDVTVKGSQSGDYDEEDLEEGEASKYSATCNLNLKKGWNRIAFLYRTANDTDYMEITTTIPSGFYWTFGSDNDDDDDQDQD